MNKDSETVVKAEPLDDSGISEQMGAAGNHSSDGKKSKSSTHRSRERSVERGRKRKRKLSRSRSNERDERPRVKKNRKNEQRKGRERRNRRRRLVVRGGRGSLGGYGGDDEHSFYHNNQRKRQRYHHQPAENDGDPSEAAVKTEVKTEEIQGGEELAPSPGENAAEQQPSFKTLIQKAGSFIPPGMPTTILPLNLDETQRQIYLLITEIEDCARRIRSAADFVPAPPGVERSLSQEELEQLFSEKLHALVKLNPDCIRQKARAPSPPLNLTYAEKVPIPQEENPRINFVGLLIGPRGNTLKALEAETGTKIIIRGKGSSRGAASKRHCQFPGADEPLHAYVTSTDSEAVTRARDKIRGIINSALENDERRKRKLRELAILNGGVFLNGANCGSDQHKTRECTEAPNITAQIMCAACGGYGHLTTDCKNPRPGFQFDGAAIDSECNPLMFPPPPPSVFGFSGQPRFLVGFPQQTPLFVMPSGPTPIARVNLAEQVKSRPKQGPSTSSVFAPSFYPTLTTDSSGYAAAAAAWAALGPPQ